ncbi:hypothetical protein PMAYCL1PPCAC_17400, partial [Pristionchus mayeri]
STYQFTCLSFIVKKVYSDFELQGIDEERLNFKTYQTIQRRMQMEETTCALQETGGSNGNGLAAGLGNATAAVSNMSSMMEGAGAKVFSLFK